MISDRYNTLITLRKKGFSLGLALPIVVFSALGAQKSAAHPVAFAGATSIMMETDPSRSDFQLFHSPYHWFSFGHTYTRLNLGVDTFHAFTPQLNFLGYRKNSTDSQTNFYLLGGEGIYYTEGVTDKTHPAHRAGAQLDFETRRIYTLAKYEHLNLDKSEAINTYEARAGFAPFLGGYNELNIWFITQLKYAKAMDENIEVTPLLRFYLKNVLWELGSSLEGKGYLNFMIHI